jgi:hypothetical protein
VAQLLSTSFLADEPATLSTDDVTRLLLLRAVEEVDPTAVPPAARGDAAVDAGDVDPPAEWLARRARLLLPHLPPPYPTLPALLGRAGRIGQRVVVGAALVAGLASNYLGPSGQIHILYNPLMALVLWNLGVYLALALVHVRRGVRHPAPPPPPTGGDGGRGTTGAAAPPGARPGAGWRLLEWVLPALAGLQHRFERGRHAAQAQAVRAKRVAGVARRFLVLGHAVAGDRAMLAVRRTLHLGAIALCLGALAGTYVRGIFLEYAVVWRSTFVRGTAVVEGILDLLLGPASILLRARGFRPWEIEGLESPAGLPAGTYIHILALTAVLALVLPRAILAGLAAMRLRRIGRLPVDLADPYYARLLEHGRALQLEAISEPLALEMKIESAKLAEAIAVFVRDQLYDARVVPVLRRFREEGGRVADLEASLAATCEAFAPQLERFVISAHDGFVRALAARAARLIGAEPVGHQAVATRPELEMLPMAGSGNPGGALGNELTDAVSVAVSTAVALAAGTVSGGIGHSLGLAIISTLLHTTGPIGFLIGAFGAFAVTAGLLEVSRDSVGEWTRNVRLPPAALRLLLRDSKLESLVAEGRQRAYADVKAQVTRDLEASAPALLDQLLAGLGPVLRRLAAERAP